MRISCPVCQEVLTKDFCAAPCGHIFHHECLTHWIQLKKPPSCPQCRRACPASKVIRLFVEEHIDVDIDPGLDSDELRASLKRALEKAKSLEDEIELLRTEVKELNDRHDKIMIDRQVDQFAISDLRKDVQKFKKAADRADMMHERNIALKEQIRSLTHQIETTESLSTVVEGSASDVSDVIKTYRNCENSTEALAKFLVSLKKEYEQLKTNYKDACNVKDRQAKMLAVEKSKVVECQRKAKESQVVRDSLESEVRLLEGEKATLNSRLDKLAAKLVSMDAAELEPAMKRKRSESNTTKFSPSQSISFSPTSVLDDDWHGEVSPPSSARHPAQKPSAMASGHSRVSHAVSGSRKKATHHGFAAGADQDAYIEAEEVEVDEEEDITDDIAHKGSSHGSNRSATASYQRADSDILPIKSIDSGHMHGLLLKSSTASQMSSVRKGYDGFGGKSKFHVRQPSKDAGAGKSSLKFGQKGLLGKPKTSHSSFGMPKAIHSEPSQSRKLFKENMPPFPNLTMRK